LTTGATVAVIAAAVSFIVAAIVLTIAAIKLWRVTDAANNTIAEVRREIIPLLQESRATLSRVDAAAVNFKDKTDKVGRLLIVVEELIGGGLVAVTASKAAQTSSIALKGLAEVMKFGLRALRGAPKES
jgi:uncharacterized protein YoxC